MTRRKIAIIVILGSGVGSRDLCSAPSEQHRDAGNHRDDELATGLLLELHLQRLNRFREPPETEGRRAEVPDLVA